MMRRGFIDYADRARSRIIERRQRVVNPITAGVIIGEGPSAAVLEVTAFADGRWELVSRQFGQSFGEIIAQGVTS